MTTTDNYGELEKLGHDKGREAQNKKIDADKKREKEEGKQTGLLLGLIIGFVVGLGIGVSRVS